MTERNAMRWGLVIAALTLNLLLLLALAAVPVSVALDLAPSVEIPRSAVSGWLLLAVPATISAAVLGGQVLGSARAHGSVAVGLALVANTFITLMVAVAMWRMYLDGRTDLALFAVATFVVFALNTALFIQESWQRRYIRPAR